jgi:hypothetical protein
MSAAVVVAAACRVCGEPAADGTGLACPPCLAAVSGLRGNLREHHLTYLATCRDRLVERVTTGERKIGKLPPNDERRPAAVALWRGLIERYERLCLVMPEGALP